MTRFRRTSAIFAIATLAALPGTSTASAAPVEHHGMQHFLAVSTGGNGGEATLIARGPITAVGTATPTSDVTDVFAFPDGSIDVTHTPRSSKDSFDEATCTGSFTERGTYEVTGGAGDFAGASGQGTYEVVGTVVGCDPEAEPTAFSFTIDAHGPIRY